MRRAEEHNEANGEPIEGNVEPMGDREMEVKIVVSEPTEVIAEEMSTGCRTVKTTWNI